MELTVDNVRDVTRQCLHHDEVEGGRPPAGAVFAQGVVATLCLHSERLEAQRANVASMLQQLPDAFHRGKGGGTTFTQMGVDRRGQTWTTDHEAMEHLLLLGTGLGLAGYVLPRQAWALLPAGLPYVWVRGEAPGE